MNANNDPLGIRSAYRSAGQIGGKAFWSSPVAKPAFFIGRLMILGTTARGCREVIAVPVDKIAQRGKEATESAGRMADIGILRRE